MFSRATSETFPVPQVLQVEGAGFIKNLEHGLPVRRAGLADSAVEAVDEEPRLLRNESARAVVVSNLALDPDASAVRRATKACYYELTLSGFALPVDDDSEVQVYSARFVATPWQTASLRRGLVVRSLTGGDEEAVVSGGASVAALSPTVNGEGDAVSFALGRAARECEIVWDARRVGHGCSAPRIAEE